MQVGQWLKEFAVRYPGVTEQNAFDVWLKANRVQFRPFLKLWLQAIPGDSAGAFWIWTSAREREPRAKRKARMVKRATDKAKRRAAYLTRRAALEIVYQAQIEEAKRMGKESGERARAKRGESAY